MKLVAQLRILRRDADRAGIQMANAHHDAAQGDQRRRGKAVFFRAQQRSDDDIAPRLELPVCFQAHAAAQLVQHQRLVRFGQAQFPRRTGVLDAGLRRCARAAVMSADQNDVGVPLGDTGRNRADANFGDQFDVDPRRGLAFFRSKMSCARSSME